MAPRNPSQRQRIKSRPVSNVSSVALSLAPYVQQQYDLAAPQSISLVTVAKPHPMRIVRGSFSVSPEFAILSEVEKRNISSELWDSSHSSELNAYNPSIARVPNELRSKLNGASYAITQRATNHHRCHKSVGIPARVVNLFSFGLLDASLERMVGHEALVALPGSSDFGGFEDCRLQTVTVQLRRPAFMLTCGPSIWQVELRLEESHDLQFGCKLPLRCSIGQSQSNAPPQHVIKHGLAVIFHSRRVLTSRRMKNLNLLEACGRLFVEVWLTNTESRHSTTSQAPSANPGRRLHEVWPLDNLTAPAALRTYEDVAILKPMQGLYLGRESWSRARGGGCCATLSAGSRTLLVGIGHVKRAETYTYAHFFYAMDDQLPLQIVAVSSPFCWPALANKRDSGEGMSNGLSGANLSSCERVQMSMSIVDAEQAAPGQTDSVVIAYGVEDCSSKAVVVAKDEVFRMLGFAHAVGTVRRLQHTHGISETDTSAS